MDQAIITAYERSGISRTVVAGLCAGWHSLTNTLKRLFGLKTSTRRQEVPRDVRQEALTRFILVLSDQQLATGLAILIGGVSNQCRITGYEFSVVLSLAWFSSTTHLATLDVLRDYFRVHRVIRNWRVGGMVALLILLTYALFTTTITMGSDSTIPVQCFFSPSSVQINKRDNIDALVALSVSSTVLTLLLLLYGYVLRIRNLYGSPNAIYWHIWKVGARIYRHRWLRLSHAEEKETFDEAMARFQASSRLRDLQRIREASGWKRWYLISSYRYDDSFLSSMSGVAFSFSYGISQVVLYRWTIRPELSAGATSMDFGQITPLFLLVLPVFAAAEIYYGEEPLEQKRKNSQLTPARLPRREPFYISFSF